MSDIKSTETSICGSTEDANQEATSLEIKKSDAHTDTRKESIELIFDSTCLKRQLLASDKPCIVVSLIGINQLDLNSWFYEIIGSIDHERFTILCFIGQVKDELMPTGSLMCCFFKTKGSNILEMHPDFVALGEKLGDTTVNAKKLEILIYLMRMGSEMSRREREQNVSRSCFRIEPTVFSSVPEDWRLVTSLMLFLTLVFMVVQSI